MSGPAPLRTVVRRTVAEAIGTAFLLAAVVGSGIAAQRLSPSDSGLELLENALATGAVLAALIVVLGPLSGAHFNPIISLVAWQRGELPRNLVAPYLCAQLAGGAAGAVVANLMFGLAPVSISGTARATPGLWLGEVVATFGLVLVAFGAAKGHSPLGPLAVAGYITSAYFFTSSTSFANPAVTLARMLSDSFAGIAPASVPPFLVAQLVGGLLAMPAVALLFQVE